MVTVEANAVAQSATVVFDPTRTSLLDLRGWVRECGYHCAGQSVPSHVCDPMDQPTATHPATGHRTTHDGGASHVGHAMVMPVVGDPERPAAPVHARPGLAMRWPNRPTRPAM